MEEPAASREYDSAYFDQLYRTHASTVFTHLLQRRVSWSDAQDLTAEVFAITWRRRATIQPHPEAGMLPWLLATANYVIADRHRMAARSRRALGRLALPVPVPDIAEDIADQAHDVARLERLAELLATLTTAEQEVIQYCTLRGLAPSVVAETTGEPVGTVRSRLSRALTKIRTAYATQGRSGVGE